VCSGRFAFAEREHHSSQGKGGAGQRGGGRAEKRACQQPQRGSRESKRATAADASPPADANDFSGVPIAEWMMGEAMKGVCGDREPVEAATEPGATERGAPDFELDQAHGIWRSRTAVP
jgi:hypothetical protein